MDRITAIWREIKGSFLFGGMDRITAIRECKQLWREIKESGLSKDDFFDSPKGYKWREKYYWNECPLCEIAWKGGRYNCLRCPLVIQYGKLSNEVFELKCYELGFNEDGCTPEWYDYIENLKEEQTQQTQSDFPSKKY